MAVSVEGGHVRRAARLAVLALALLCAACVTTPEQQSTAVQRLKAVWAGEDQAIRAREGEAIFTATPDQAARAARAAFASMGLQVDDRVSNNGQVIARQFYLKGGFTWTPAVRSVEEARARNVFIQAIGPQGAQLALVPRDETVVGTAMIQPAGGAALRVSVDFRTPPADPSCVNVSCVDELPPEALRLALRQFWPAFRAALIRIQAEDAAKPKPPAAKPPGRKPAKPAKPKAKPPSGWTPPPSGWTPPPKK